MGEDKGLFESLLEEVNALPIEVILTEHEKRGMYLVINDGYIVDMIYY